MCSERYLSTKAKVTYNQKKKIFKRLDSWPPGSPWSRGR